MLYFFALFSQAYSSHPNIYYRAFLKFVPNEFGYWQVGHFVRLAFVFIPKTPKFHPFPSIAGIYQYLLDESNEFDPFCFLRSLSHPVCFGQ
jgi:hypothetical protein